MGIHATTMTPEALEEWTTARFLNHYRSKRQAMIRDKITKIQTSNRAFEEHWEVSGLGTLSLIGEGMPIPYDEPVQGNRRRIFHLTYGLGYRVTQNMKMDDRWDVVSAMNDDLLDSATDHRERIAHAPWNDAFAGASYLTLDGQPFVSTSHTSLKGGGTRSNRLNPDVELSPEGVEALMTQAELTVDEQGRFIPFKPSKLFTHPNNRWEAMRIFESQGRPGTQLNDMNTLSTMGVDFVFSPYLSDTDAWFLFDPETFMVLWYDRMKPTPDTGSDFDTKSTKITLHYRAGCGVPKWEGVFGSSGA